MGLFKTATTVAVASSVPAGFRVGNNNGGPRRARPMWQLHPPRRQRSTRPRHSRSRLTPSRSRHRRHRLSRRSHPT